MIRPRWKRCGSRAQPKAGLVGLLRIEHAGVLRAALANLGPSVLPRKYIAEFARSAPSMLRCSSSP